MDCADTVRQPIHVLRTDQDHGIEPVKRRQAGSRTAQSWLTSEQQEQLNYWAGTMARGASLTQIRGLIAGQRPALSSRRSPALSWTLSLKRLTRVQP